MIVPIPRGAAAQYCSQSTINAGACFELTTLPRTISGTAWTLCVETTNFSMHSVTFAIYAASAFRAFRHRDGHSGRNDIGGEEHDRI